MMRTMVMAAALAACVGGASAQSFYVGAGFGATQSKLEVDCRQATCDKDGNGYKAYGGYVVHKYVAVEAGYINFGDAKGEGRLFGVNNVRGKFTSGGPYVAGAFRYALSDEAIILARLGVINMKTEASGQLGSLGSGRESESANKLLYGIGVELPLTKKLYATFGLDFSESAEIFNAEGSLRMLSVGVHAKF